MRRELTEKIMAAETVEAYEVAVKALAEHLINAGEPEKAQLGDGIRVEFIEAPLPN